MPLSTAGDEMLAGFIKKYGEKKGTSYFYAYLNSHPAIGKKVHKTKKGKAKYNK